MKLGPHLLRERGHVDLDLVEATNLGTQRCAGCEGCEDGVSFLSPEAAGNGVVSGIGCRSGRGRGIGTARG